MTKPAAMLKCRWCNMCADVLDKEAIERLAIHVALNHKNKILEWYNA